MISKEILALIEDLPVTILEKKQTFVTKDQIERLYALVDPAWLPEIVDNHLKGPCILLVLQGDDGICKQVETLGNQIRKQYGLDKVRNCIHTSDNHEKALSEIPIFFQEIPFEQWS